MKKTRYVFLAILAMNFWGCSKSEDIISEAPDELASGSMHVSKNVFVSTLAGSSGNFADGFGANARFLGPRGIAQDKSGNLIVADVGNERFRKVTLSGNVTTPNFIETDPDIRFDIPFHLFITKSGVIYYTDQDHNYIRKIVNNRKITIIGPFSNSGFDGTGGIVVDKKGNIFVADIFNNQIKKVTPSGKVSVFAGSGAEGSRDGKGKQARFRRPSTLAIDKLGNIYVTDGGNNKIRKITCEGVVSTVAGCGSQGSADGPALKASFYSPHGIAVDDSGTLFVTDFNNNKIRKISRGRVSTLAGTGARGNADGPALEATFAFPSGLTVAESGEIYVSDAGNNRIRKIAFKK